MRKTLQILFISIVCFGFASPAVDSQAEALKKELGIIVISSKEEVPTNATTIHLINQGDTDWLKIKRLQGWLSIPLNEEGIEEAHRITQQLAGISLGAIYTSDLKNASQLADILHHNRNCILIQEADLRGENHGEFNGLTPAEYKKHPEYRDQDALTPAEELFTAVGFRGETKADLARRALPAIEKMCAEHPGDAIAVVSHGGLFKILNFYRGQFDPSDGGTVSIPHGTKIVIYGDSSHLYLIQQ